MSDFRLDDDGDLAVSAGGDVEIVAAAALIAQDLAETCRTPIGSLFWDREAGSDILKWLNSPYQRTSEVLGELRRIALADDRVAGESIDAFVNEDGDYDLVFTPLGSDSAATVTIAANA